MGRSCEVAPTSIHDMRRLPRGPCGGDTCQFSEGSGDFARLGAAPHSRRAQIVQVYQASGVPSSACCKHGVCGRLYTHAGACSLCAWRRRVEIQAPQAIVLETPHTATPGTPCKRISCFCRCRCRCRCWDRGWRRRRSCEGVKGIHWRTARGLGLGGGGEGVEGG